MLPTVRKNDQNWLPSFFNDFFSEEWPMIHTATSAAPAINVKEDEKAYHVEIAAPGMTKEDFKVHINDQDELVVSVEKKQENKEEDKKLKFLRHEFNYSHFEQSLLLPDNVNKETITAKVENGILNIELPKLDPVVQKQPTKVIDIQ